jgi:hypothetical protein
MHHAYLLVGSVEDTERHFASEMARLGIETAGNPDFLALRSENFGIGEARLLSERAAFKSFRGKKIFLIPVSRMTVEAQNALLKTLEDPRPETHFYFTARTSGEFIPTLLSRMQVVRVSGSGETSNELVEKFVSMPIPKRLLFAKKFADDEGNLAVFLDDLMKLLQSKGKPLVELESIYSFRRYAGDRAAAPRLVLEHLALVL